MHHKAGPLYSASGRSLRKSSRVCLSSLMNPPDIYKSETFLRIFSKQNGWPYFSSFLIVQMEEVHEEIPREEMKRLVEKQSNFIKELCFTITNHLEALQRDLDNVAPLQLPMHLKVINEVVERYNLLMVNLGALQRNTDDIVKQTP